MRAIPPLAKLSEQLHRDIELAVRRFARFNKYQIGADLRQQAMEVRRLVDRAWRDQAQRAYWSGELVWAIDEIKLTLQMGSQLRAFASFGQFEALIRLAEELGAQAGGWKRSQQQNPKGQNSPPSTGSERAQILSTHAASMSGANR